MPYDDDQFLADLRNAGYGGAAVGGEPQGGPNPDIGYQSPLDAYAADTGAAAAPTGGGDLFGLGSGTAQAAGTGTGLGGLGGFGSQSMIGLGLGLLGGNPFNRWGPALQGYQAGARADLAARTQAENAAYRQQALAQQERLRQQEMALQHDIAFRDPESIRTVNALIAQGIPRERAMEMMFPRTEDWVPIVTEQGAFSINKRTGEMRPLGEPGQYRKIGAREEAAIASADDAVIASQNLITTMQRAKELSPKAAAGPYAAQRGEVSAALGLSGGAETNSLQALMSEAALEKYKTAFGPKPPRTVLKMVDDLRESLNKPDSARQAIYDEVMRMAQEQLRVNTDRAQKLRAGQYYSPGGGPARSERERAKDELLRRGIRLPE